MVAGNNISREEILNSLSGIPDPEIPVISIHELGMLRDVQISGDECIVTITPTYTGCPAMGLIEEQVKEKLHAQGIENVKVEMVYSPAWTTDWMSESAKEKMRQYGISPPQHSACSKTFGEEKVSVRCPQCNSSNTQVISQFGSTACKALCKCNSCKEPFEHFKCH